MEKLNFEQVIPDFKVLDETCAIHPNEHLILLLKFNQKFCKLCQLKEIEEQEKELVKKHVEDSTRGYLKRYSMVDDVDEYNCTFRNFKAVEGSKEAQLKYNARQLAGRYLKYPNLKMSTIFYGTPGAGKTHLAMAILNAINENSNPQQKCLFINANTLYQKLKAGFRQERGSISEIDATKLFVDADLVVLDDLGSESAMRTGSEASNYLQQFLYGVTNKQKRIITTTNLTQDQLLQTYNPKIISRLRANSKGALFDFAGIEDKRW